jgi:signal transduction histidine kinase
MNKHIKIFLVSLLIAMLPESVYAAGYLPHDYPAIYIHMIGRVFFLISMIAVIIFILRNSLHKTREWKLFLISLIFFSFWDFMVFTGRLRELEIIGSTEGWEYFKRMAMIKDSDIFFYFMRFDYLALNAGMFFFYLSLRAHSEETTKTTTGIISPALMLPVLPVIAVQIGGGVVFIALSFMCLGKSIQLYRRHKEEILWNYMMWLSASFCMYAVSRSFAYILQHFLVADGHKDIWEYIDPYSGSANTIFFFWIGFISLFFIIIYKVYLKIKAEEKQLEKVNLDLIQLNRELETLVAERTMALMGLTVADRVRNPAVLIGALCKRIVKKEEKLNEDLLDVIDECKKLETIVSEFETLLKTRQSVFEYGDLNELLNSVVSTLEQELSNKQIELQLKLAPEPMRINLQRNLLKAAIYHVIRNALEATPPGGMITIATAEEADNIALSIADTGRGIHQENLERIFDPFYSTKELRFGMGLPLVRQIVSEHLGELKITSDFGKGTTVKMIFPVRWKPKK